MHIRRTLFLASWMLAFVPAGASAQPAPSASPAAEDPMSDKARELFNEGKKLYREGKFGQAEASFEAAWGLALQSKGIAANLGDCELRLGKFREAAEHLAISARLAPPEDPQRAKTMASLAAAKAKIGTLVVKTNIPAEVMLDGKRIGDAPLLDPIFVDPGKVKLRVRQEGYTSWEKEIDVAAGQEIPLDVALQKPAPIPTATATVTTTATAPPPPNRVPAYVAFGVGGVGLLVGIATGAVALSMKSDLVQKCSPAKECPLGVRGDYDTMAAMSHASTVGLVAAGLGTAVGVTLLVIDARKSATKTSLVVGPTFVGVKGAF